MKKTEIEIILNAFSNTLQRLIVYLGQKHIKKNQEYIRLKNLNKKED